MGLSWDPGLLPGHRAWGFRFGQGFGAAGVKQLSSNNVTRSFGIRALGFRFRLQPETCKFLVYVSVPEDRRVVHQISGNPEPYIALYNPI